ncbi:MAG: SDR family oxidoreductase [Verrucomicrobium sp.]|jgi:nucleoside-diphosphate-sugar epimerase|nr:SDR family oxidoreductase [Verrucomicrobium sp.]
MRILIVGCGYVGLELGRRLASSGAEVLGLRRRGDDDGLMAGAGLQAVHGDLTRPEDLEAIPGDFDAVVSTVSSGRGGIDAYHQVYLGGAGNLVDWSRRRRAGRLVWVSSTSVYGQADGSWVTEDSPTAPEEPTSRCLVAAEQAITEGTRSGVVPTQIVRVAGIYGPGRGHLFRQFIAGEARLDPGQSPWMNMIHRDDVASALEAVLHRGEPGRIYNAVDDEPVTRGEFLRYLAQATGLPLAPAAEAGGSVPTRKRGSTNKRVSNGRLREELGWRPRFPTWREGYAEAIAGVVSATRRHDDRKASG